MTTLLALDPGRQGFGWALFRGGVLVQCGVIPQPKAVRAYAQPTPMEVVENVLRELIFRTPVDACVVERMVVYPKRPGKKETEHSRTATANDLLDLQLIGAFVAGTYCAADRTTYLTPSAWKGSTDTTVIERRLAETDVITDAERALVLAVKPAGLRHNAVDAVALGLVALKRMRIV